MIDDRFKHMLKSDTVNDYLTPMGVPILRHWAEQIHKRLPVPESVMFGSICAELIYKRMVRKEDISLYRKKALYVLESNYPAHEYDRMKEALKTRYEEGKAHITAHAAEWASEAGLRQERDRAASEIHSAYS